MGKWNVTVQGGAPTGMGASPPVGNPTPGAPPAPAGPEAPQIASSFSDPAKTTLHVEVKEGMDPKQFELKVTK